MNHKQFDLPQLRLIKASTKRIIMLIEELLELPKYQNDNVISRDLKDNKDLLLIIESHIEEEAKR